MSSIYPCGFCSPDQANGHIIVAPFDRKRVLAAYLANSNEDIKPPTRCGTLPLCLLAEYGEKCAKCMRKFKKIQMISRNVNEPLAYDFMNFGFFFGCGPISFYSHDALTPWHHPTPTRSEGQAATLSHTQMT